MKTILNELKNIKNCLKNLGTNFNKKKDLKRIHKNNQFNRRLSTVLNSFSDIETIITRLEKNINDVQSIEKQIQKRFNNEDRELIQEYGQKLRKKAHEINKKIL